MLVDWYGEEASEERVYAQFLMEEFYGREVERMKRPHACEFVSPLPFRCS